MGASGNAGAFGTGFSIGEGIFCGGPETGSEATTVAITAPLLNTPTTFIQLAIISPNLLFSLLNATNAMIYI
ncbi:MAG: hypothetical protein AAB618_03895 [Patescibacteria group bacterium]